METNPILIEIPLDEYKELLIIKGRYEELKDSSKGNCSGPCHPTQLPTVRPTITWATYNDDEDKKKAENPYKVTLKDTLGNTYATLSSTWRDDKRKKR